MKPETMRRRAAELLRQAAEIEARRREKQEIVSQIDALAVQLARLEDRRSLAEFRSQAAELLRRAASALDASNSSDLPSFKDSATNTTVDPNKNNLNHNPKRVFRGRPIETAHPLPQKVRESGESIADLAVRLSKVFGRNFPQQTVQAWYTANERYARPIPRDVAEYFEREPWSIPLSAWKNGIRDA
jgi:hypothetical protein